MSKKLTNEDIDKRLQEQKRTILRIGNVITSIIKIEWQCTNIIEGQQCNYKWLAKPIEVVGFNKTGCPKCKKVVRMTNTNIDERLLFKNRKIERLGDSMGASKYIKWRCLKCEFVWECSPNSILNNESNCPNCYPYTNKTKTNEKFLIESNKIHGDEFEYLEECKGNSIPILMRHKKCGKEFYQSPKEHNNKRKPQGCPRCKESVGENKIFRFLTNKKYRFDRQKKLPGCKFKRLLRFDFCIYDDFGNIKYLIEYNGLDHYPPIDKNHIKNKSRYNWKNYNKNHARDLIKESYCEENDLKLIIIPYWDFDKIEEILKREIIF